MRDRTTSTPHGAEVAQSGMEEESLREREGLDIWRRYETYEGARLWMAFKMSFVLNPTVYWEPMKLVENGGDVVKRSFSCDASGEFWTS